MAGQSKSISFIRKLSIFYFLLAALGAFFAFYYLKFIPDNKAGLEKRGFRALKMFSANIVSRNNDIINIFNPNKKGFPGSSGHVVKTADDFTKMVNKADVYRQFNSLYPYSVENSAHNFKNGFAIDRSSAQEWFFYYQPGLDTVAVRIAPTDIVGRSLTGNTGVFNAYLLLKQDTAVKEGYNIVYDQNNTATSSILNLDTLKGLQKNTDQTAIISMNLSGTDYKMFLNPFTLGGQNLMLVGLMTKQNYNRQANYAPIGNTMFIIILVVLIVLSLPFIKIFTLSPREKIAFPDVVGTAISIFSGSAIIIIIIAALFINWGINKAATVKLDNISAVIKKDVEDEISQASAQLNEYDKKFNNDSNKVTLNWLSTIAYAHADSLPTKKADTIFYPSIYKNIYRVFWVTAQGKTIAKWNPFNFYAPLTDVTSQHFYKMLAGQDNNDTVRNFVLYPDVSNATGEFQVFLARRVNPAHAYISPKKDSAAYLAVSAFFNTSILPVLPKDLGFCIVDNSTGTVLMHTDSKRNLQENIFDETEQNEELMQRIHYKEEAHINDIQLYGAPHQLYSVPITGQPLSLVVFYDKTSLYNSIFRIVYFALQILFCIYCCIAVCITWYSLSGRKTSKLNFGLVTTEWFRPSLHNALSYFFTKKYFGGLLVLAVTFLTLNVIYNWDTRNIFCLCVLLPIFTLLGFVTSRNKDTLLNTQGYVEGISAKSIVSIKQRSSFIIKKYYFNTVQVIKNSVLVFLALLLFIVIISITVYHTGFYSTSHNIFFLFFFSVMIFFLLCKHFYNTYGPADIAKYTNPGKELEEGIKAAYRASLFRGMLLIGIIPAIGIIYYASTAERVQQKKYDALSIAAAFQNRADYVKHKIIESYKPLYAGYPQFKKYLDDTLTVEKGIYFDGLQSVAVKQVPPVKHYQPVPDQPYGDLMSAYPVFAYYNAGNYFIDNVSADYEWEFRYSDTALGSLLLIYNTGNKAPVVVKTSNLFVNFPGFTAGSLTLFLLLPAAILCIFCIICWYLFGQIMRRLFLVDYLPKNECMAVNEQYLKNIFDNPAPEDKGTLYLNSSNTPLPPGDWREAFKTEKEFMPAYMPCPREEYILANCFYYEKLYAKMWGGLSKEEQYLLYDLAYDDYTNYRDVTPIYMLLNKGILMYNDLRLQFFSYSFKSYVLSKKGSKEVEELKAEIATPGTWEALRIPLLILIGITGIFLFITQSDLSHQVTAIITSAAAIIPLLLKLTEKFSGGKPEAKA